MKVLFDHSSPFLLAHGGFQIQIEETRRALEELGIEVEYLRWWDEKQCGDIIHFFGRPAGVYIDLAHQKNICVVVAELLTGLASRAPAVIGAQAIVIRSVQNLLPRSFWAKMGWDAYAKADRIIALTGWEAELMQRVFGAPVNRVAVIPNGVAEEFLSTNEQTLARQDYLICTATITERKRILETAKAAIKARTPFWVIGKPYAVTDPYARRFLALAKERSDLIRYEGSIEDRYQLARAYRQARGFVLLSTQESLSLSALEAAACGCPLLLSDLPWARTVFKDEALYCPVASIVTTAQVLREFYDSAPSLKPSPKSLSWIEVAQQLKAIYEDLLRTRR